MPLPCKCSAGWKANWHWELYRKHSLLVRNKETWLPLLEKDQSLKGGLVTEQSPMGDRGLCVSKGTALVQIGLAVYYIQHCWQLPTFKLHALKNIAKQNALELNPLC